MPFMVSCAHRLAAMLVAVAALSQAPPAGAQQPAPSPDALIIVPVAEKKLTELPAGTLYWHVENFATLAQAQAAAGPASLAGEVAGKAWLLTLAPKDSAARGGTKVIEIGPLPPITATEYLLRLNNAGGPGGGRPGVKTPPHVHPGHEFLYVVAGRLTQQTPKGIEHAEAGQYIKGHGEDVGIVSSSGTANLTALGIFVLDATKPFASPAAMR